MDNSNAKKGFLIILVPVFLVIGIIMSLLLGLGAGVAGVDDCQDQSDSTGQSQTGSGSQQQAAPVSDNAAENVKNYLPELQEASKTSGFSVSLIAALIQQESGWNPKIVSPSGAKGVGQFMDGTWPTYGTGDPFNPHDAIPAVGRYLKDIRRIMHENNVPGDETDIILRSYNAGPYSVIARSGGANGGENNDYAPRIRGYWPQYQQIVKDLGIEDNPSGSDEAPKPEAGPAPHPETQNNSGQDNKAAQSSTKRKDCKDKNKSQDGASSAQDGSVSGNDDYPWKHLPHCDGNESNCPDSPDPTHSYPSECTAFAAWRVIQQTGGNENNITFYSPGSAKDWKGYWDSQGWSSGSKPVVGAVVWYGPGKSGASSYGHVAVVKEVYEDGSFMEEGYNGNPAPNDHTYYTRKMSNEAPSSFLYIPKEGK